VGWSQAYPNMAVILFKDKMKTKNRLRMEFCKKIFDKYAAEIIEIPSKGKSTIEKTLYWIHWATGFLFSFLN